MHLRVEREGGLDACDTTINLTQVFLRYKTFNNVSKITYDEKISL